MAQILLKDDIMLQALLRACVAAKEAHPTEAARIQTGAGLLINGKCRQDAHRFYVRSNSRADREYLVNASCQCESAQYLQAEERCKHRWSVWLYRWILLDPAYTMWFSKETPEDVEAMAAQGHLAAIASLPRTGTDTWDR